MKITGRDGLLRILDGSDVIHGQTPHEEFSVDMVVYNGVSYVNYTSDLEDDDSSAVLNMLLNNNYKIYVGSTVRFAKIKFVHYASGDPVAGAGGLSVKYYAGSFFNFQAVSGLDDNTAVGGNTFAQDGIISFEAPGERWVQGADDYDAALDSDKYYIELGITSTPTDGGDFDLLAPVDGQFLDLTFAQMDFSGPCGRPLVEENLIMDRDRMDSKAHYVVGPDGVIYDPMEITFSFLLDDTYNKDSIRLALLCGNPSTAHWNSAGVTTKGTTKNDGTNLNPLFSDSAHKCVNIQVLWIADPEAYKFGLAYYETLFLPDKIMINESADGVIVNVTGGVYGLIEIITAIANRY